MITFADDPLSQIKYERGDKIFGCFVEGCDRMCSTPSKRKRHLIDKHCFPEVSLRRIGESGRQRTDKYLLHRIIISLLRRTVLTIAYHY
jgi:hypothetical protein